MTKGRHPCTGTRERGPHAWMTRINSAKFIYLRRTIHVGPGFGPGIKQTLNYTEKISMVPVQG